MAVADCNLILFAFLKCLSGYIVEESLEMAKSVCRRVDQEKDGGSLDRRKWREIQYLVIG